MADQRSTVQIVFDGAVSGLVAAANAARNALRGVSEDQDGFLRRSNGQFAARGRELSAFSTAFGSLRGAAAAAGSGLLKVTAGLGALAAASGAVNVVAGLGAALAAAAPAALVLPGILLGAAAAFAAVKIATAGFGEALSAADPAAFAEATKNMAPTAVAAAEAIRAMKPAFDELRQSVQGEFFRGFAAELTKVGANVLPIVRDGLVGLAGPLGEITRQGIEVTNNPLFKGALATIFENTRGALVGMEGSLADVLSGFVELGAVGSEFLPGIGESIGNATARFQEFVRVGVESGSIKESIDGALVVLRQFGEVAGNIGSVVGSIFTGLSGGQADQFLGSLVASTAALAAFFETASAQSALGALGETLAVVSTAMSSLFLTALQVAAPIIGALAPLVQSLATSIGAGLSGALVVLGPPLTALVTALSGALAPVLPVIAGAFVQLATALAPVVAAAGPLVEVLGTALASALSTLLPVLGPIATIIGEILVTAIAALTPILPPLVDAFTQVAAVVGQILLAALTAIAPFIPQLVGAFTNLVAAVLPLLPPILDLAQNLIPIFVAALGFVIPIVINVVNVLVSIVQAVVTVVAAVIQFAADFVGAISGMVASVITFVGNLVAGVQGFFGGMFALVISIVSGGVAGIIGFFGSLVSTVVGAIAGFVRRVVDFFTNLSRDILGSLASLPGRMVTLGRQIIDGIVNGLRAAGAAVGRFLTGLARDALNSVKRFLGIASPSRVFRDQVGKQIGAGLADGIKASTGGVIAQARALTAAAVDAAAPARVATAATTGQAAAARELLARVQAGGAVFEDLSFRGASANLGRFNDGLADQFYGQGGGDLRAFLERIAAQGQTAPEVRVFIGDQELRGIIRTEQTAADRATSRTVRAGAM